MHVFVLLIFQIHTGGRLWWQTKEVWLMTLLDYFPVDPTWNEHTMGCELLWMPQTDASKSVGSRIHLSKVWLVVCNVSSPSPLRLLEVVIWGWYGELMKIASGHWKPTIWNRWTQHNSLWIPLPGNTDVREGQRATNACVSKGDSGSHLYHLQNQCVVFGHYNYNDHTIRNVDRSKGGFVE